MEGGLTWRTSYLSTAGPSPPPLFGHSAVLLSHTHLVTFGGAVESYDKHIISGDLTVLTLPTRLWSPVTQVAGEMPSPRASHACVGVEPNRVLIHGGVIGAGSLADEEIYVLEIDFPSASAKAVCLKTDGKKPTRRYAHTMTTIGSKVFLYGGIANGTVMGDLWMLENYAWVEVTMEGTGPEARCYHTAGHYVNHLGRDFLIVFGGRGKEQRALGDMWTLTATGTGLWRWVWVANSAQGRYMHSMAMTGEDCYILGGRSEASSDPLPSVHIDLSTCRMEMLPIHPAYRQVSFYESGCVYLLGGYIGKDTLTNLVTCIELDSPIPTPIRRNRPSATCTPQKLYCPKLHLSPFVTVSSGKHYDDHRNLYETSVKKVAISRLHTEAKKLNVRSNSPAYSIASNANDSAHNFIIYHFLRPSDSSTDLSLPKDVVLALLDSAAAIVESEVESIELREPVKIFGSLHGQLPDLLRYFREYGEPSEAPFTGDIDSTDYVFAGEHIGAGRTNVETLCLLLALKVKFPESIYILRTPTWSQQSLHTLSVECSAKYSENPQSPASAFTRLVGVISKLPTEAAVADTVYCKSAPHTPQAVADFEQRRVTLVCEEDAKGGLDICDTGFTVKFTSAPSLPGEKKRPGCLIVVTKALQIVPKFIAPREYV